MIDELLSLHNPDPDHDLDAGYFLEELINQDLEPLTVNDGIHPDAGLHDLCRMIYRWFIDFRNISSRRNLNLAMQGLTAAVVLTEATAISDPEYIELAERLGEAETTMHQMLDELGLPWTAHYMTRRYGKEG